MGWTESLTPWGAWRIWHVQKKQIWGKFWQSETKVVPWSANWMDEVMNLNLCCIATTGQRQVQIQATELDQRHTRKKEIVFPQGVWSPEALWGHAQPPLPFSSFTENLVLCSIKNDPSHRTAAPPSSLLLSSPSVHRCPSLLSSPLLSPSVHQIHCHLPSPLLSSSLASLLHPFRLLSPSVYIIQGALTSLLLSIPLSSFLHSSPLNFCVFSPSWDQSRCHIMNVFQFSELS